MPLHSIGGVGGIVLTPTALLVNPGPPGTVFGKPAFSAAFVDIGEKDFEAVAVTWTLWRRLELGYGFNRLGLGDLPRDIRRATGIDIGTHDVHLHNFNARLNIIQENQWDQTWLPAVTVGAHYKYNDNIDKINRRLGDLLDTIGYNDNDGVDFTLTASKHLTFLPRPVLVSAGARASKGAQLGLLGFTSDYHVTFEGHAVMFVTDRLAVGAEYRQKPDQLGRIPGLIRGEDDWWDVCAAYIINDQMTVKAAVGDFGTIANHRDQIAIGLGVKYEF